MSFPIETEIPVGVAIASAATSALVAILAAAFSVIAFRAYKKRANVSMRAVGLAFLVFALRNLFSAFNVITDVIHHGVVELVLSLFDLALMVLLPAPLVMRRR